MKQFFTLIVLIFFTTTLFAQNDITKQIKYKEFLQENFNKQHNKNVVKKAPYKGAVNQQDSLALVSLYNATDGNNWTKNDNWLTGNVSTWYGVILNDDGKVTMVSLANNNLTDTITPEIGNLSNLTKLDLSYNHLIGSIPIEIGNLSKLNWLDLGGNQLTDSIPHEIGNLTNLYNLYLWGNKLSGSIPIEIGNLINLTKLNLNSNQLTGSIPHEIGNLTNLKQIAIEGNQLTGSIPYEIGNLVNLTVFDLPYNQLTGSIPEEIGNLKNLEYLYLNDNQLTGSIPKEIGNLTNLEYLYLKNNNLEDSIPSEIGNLTNLTQCYLNENQLTGSIPKEIGNLTNLQYLYLNNNKLKGSIPPEIGNLSNLNWLYLTKNQLTGSIPKEIGNLSSLSKCYLDSNRLTGSIPKEFGNLSNLSVIYLNNNKLSGAIPSEISNLSGLNWIYLNDNQFTDLPDLTALTNMQGWYILDNKFTFEDIEPNINVGNYFHYSPQAKVGSVEHYTPNVGSNVGLSVNVGGDHNTYQWYKNNVEISGAVNNTYTIANYALSDSGVYVCKISNTVATDLVLVSENKYVGVDIQSFNISVSVNPTNGGTVIGAGVYNDGDTANLIARPDSAYNFVNWTLNGSEVSTDTSYSFTVTSDTALVVNFLQIHTVFASVSPTDAGVISGAGTYNDGETATLSVRANTGYNFINWTSADTEITTATSFSLSVTSDTLIVANFELQSFSVSVSSNPILGGVVTGSGTYNYGDTVTLTATTNTGYRFVNWTTNGTEVSTDTSYSFTVTSDTMLVANFVQIFDVAASANPTSGGTISGTGIYNYGDTATLTATSNTGYDFVNWTSHGAEFSTNTSISIKVITDTTFVANFKLKSFNISAGTDPVDGGTVTGLGIYNYGDTATLKAISNTGFDFVNWTSNSIGVSTDTVISFTVTNDTSFIANFKEKTSVTEFSNQMSFTLYPNPVKDIINIKLNNLKVNNSKCINITMFDYLGKSRNINYNKINSDNIQIDVSNKPAGIYFLRITEDNNLLKMCKFIIVK